MKMGLVPNDRDHGWVPYVWLVFMAFFIVPPIFAPHTTARDWQITIAATAVFLVLYFKLFWTGPPWNYVLIAGMAAMVRHTAAVEPIKRGLARMRHLRSWEAGS